MSELRRLPLFLIIYTPYLVGMNGDGFVKRFNALSCDLGKLSNAALKAAGDTLCLNNYSAKDIIALGQSITTYTEETAVARRNEEPYEIPGSISAGDSLVKVCDGAKELRIQCDGLDICWSCKDPVLVLALSQSGEKLCIGCGKYGRVEELVFFSISRYRCVLAAMISGISYQCIPYSLQWGNDEESITLYGRWSTEYRKLATKIPNAIFFLKNYECCKYGNN